MVYGQAKSYEHKLFVMAAEVLNLSNKPLSGFVSWFWLAECHLSQVYLSC
jgi:hypothetical protein